MNTTNKTNKENRISAIQLTGNYVKLAELFLYPIDESFKNNVNDIYNSLLETIPEAAEAMNPFMAFLSRSSFTAMQELFLRSFDVQAITTLDIGFTLFGEDYKRGQLLVHLNKEHRDAGNDCQTELSDHLPNVLKLIQKMKDEVMRAEIASRLVIPAVVKMIEEFSNEKIEKKDVVYKKNYKSILDYSQDYRTVYQALLEALLIVLKKDFGCEAQQDELQMEKDVPEIGACQINSTCSCSSSIKDYGQIIETEMLIEKD
jgi:nitrate reductase assembly molybdenum cofactor insertion protein NarJ